MKTRFYVKKSSDLQAVAKNGTVYSYPGYEVRVGTFDGTFTDSLALAPMAYDKAQAACKRLQAAVVDEN